MNYSGLYSTEAIFLLIIALWFARQLNCFSLFKSINDPQRILPPTIVLFTGLFLIPYLSYLYHDLSRDSVILEILKASTPLISIITFFIGQYTAKREKCKEKEEQEKVAATKILSWLQKFIKFNGFSEIESSINIDHSAHFNLENLKKICEDRRKHFSNKLQEIKTDQSIFNSSYREKMISYLIEGEKLFKEIQDENYCDVIVRSVCLYEYKAYEHKFYLCKNTIKDNLLLQSDLLFLKSRKKKILLRWKEKRKSIIKKYKNLYSKYLTSKFRSVSYNEEVDKELECLDKKYPHLAEYCFPYKDIEEDYYEDIEEDLIAYIDEILNEYR